MLGFLGSLLGAGSSLLGGIMGQNSSKDIAAQNIAEQEAFAQHGISWKAADARNAEAQYGINPLVSMGASTSSFSNVVGDNSMGAGVANAGQDIGRAVSALAPEETRKADLSNKLIEAQIANVNSDTVKNQAIASQATRQAPTNPAPPLYQRFSDGHGGFVTLPSKDASQAMQNWGSMPAQIGIAAGEVGHSLGDAYNAVVRPWVDRLGQLPHRGDWRRRDDRVNTPLDY